MIFRDKLCLAIDTPELDRAQGLIRDFRGCTSLVKLGLPFFMAQGPCGVRSISEMGIHSLVIDTRLFGSPADIHESVVALAQLPSVVGMTVQIAAGDQSLKAAMDAAVTSQRFTGRISPPKIVGVMLPPAVETTELSQNLKLKCDRAGYVRAMTKLALFHQLDGMVVNFTELGYVKALAPKIALMVATHRRVVDPMVALPENERHLPGIQDVMQGGAAHVIFHAALIGRSNAEWTADWVAKEVTLGGIAMDG